jgi:hypothetical protein
LTKGRVRRHLVDRADHAAQCKRWLGGTPLPKRRVKARTGHASSEASAAAPHPDTAADLAAVPVDADEADPIGDVDAMLGRNHRGEPWAAGVLCSREPIAQASSAP